MKVNVSISYPQKSREFARFILSYGEQNVTEVALDVDYGQMYAFTGLQTGIAFDLFVIACISYGVDILLPRLGVGYDGWSREIEISYPVENVGVFTNGKLDLEQMLNFLTGDVWTISFEQRETTPLYIAGKRSKVCAASIRNSYKVVNLFSGGMDSLIGAIDHLSNSTDRICLVSHTDSMFKGAKNDQLEILKLIGQKYNHFHHIPTRVNMEKRDLHGNKYAKETTLRSRSFLFLSMAILVADSIDTHMPVYIPENGTISLNYPLTPSRRSSCSTRTTHPYFLNLMQKFLGVISLSHQIENKYQYCTKGEMVERCGDRELLLNTYGLSCSCGKRGTRKDIRDNGHVPHCGVCMPCVYRRAALHKIGISEQVGTDIFRPKKRKIYEIPDMPALISFIRTNHSLNDIEKGLLVNGSLPIEHLREYANVVYHAREEIKKWIRDEATIELKKEFGLC